MKDLCFIFAVIAILAGLTGCYGDTPSAGDSFQKENGIQGEKEIQNEDFTDGNIEKQAFTGMELKITEGTLHICHGASFSLLRRDGTAMNYEIKDGILCFENVYAGEMVLTLPDCDSYESLSITVNEGHVYGEKSLTIQSLKLDVEQGDVRLEAVTVEGDSSIKMKEGSVFLNGNPGHSVTADCQVGKLSIGLNGELTDYNYALVLSEGSVRIGEKNYHGRTVSQNVDNGGKHSMNLTCNHGDISVEVEKR